MSRELNYIKTGMFLTWKKMLEYKANTYSAILAQIIYFVSQFLVLFVISSNFGDVIGWSFLDFVFYLLLFDFVETIAGFFIWGRSDLKSMIVKGELNCYINRPLNKFICFNASIFSAGGTIMLFITSIFLVFFILFFNVELYNILFGIFIAFLIIIFHIVLRKFVESINFFNFGVSYFLRETVYRSQRIFTNYPAKFFQGGFFRIIFMIIPLFFVSSLLLPVLRNKEVWNLNLQIFILVSLIIVFGFGIFIFWKFGLKKYEAYG